MFHHKCFPSECSNRHHYCKFAHILQENGVESVIYKNLTVEKATEELAKLEILIGMRFHACLVASKFPVCPIMSGFE